jgi:hypothetical protein
MANSSARLSMPHPVSCRTRETPDNRTSEKEWDRLLKELDVLNAVDLPLWRNSNVLATQLELTPID